MVRAYIGLGSNLDQPAQQIRRAITTLGNFPHTQLAACSRLYRSSPLGPQDQPDFVNAVVALDTELDAIHLLHALQGVEQQQGRVRSGEQWGPRTLDLDILLYGQTQRCDCELTLPHPHAHMRDFVLIPLLEVAPDIAIPGIGKAYDLIKTCSSNGLVSIEDAPL